MIRRQLFLIVSIVTSLTGPLLDEKWAAIGFHY